MILMVLGPKGRTREKKETLDACGMVAFWVRAHILPPSTPLPELHMGDKTEKLNKIGGL